MLSYSAASSAGSARLLHLETSSWSLLYGKKKNLDFFFVFAFFFALTSFSKFYCFAIKVNSYFAAVVGLALEHFTSYEVI